MRPYLLMGVLAVLGLALLIFVVVSKRRSDPFAGSAEHGSDGLNQEFLPGEVPGGPRFDQQPRPGSKP
ncbi:hypothetical protein [Longispora albida]|uniref:hypothetical protein n=1 Tax=Longispora albida TaxID=203523 RepID=UPI00039CDDF9|nr:hypothetical protein [Longispora albida]